MSKKILFIEDDENFQKAIKGTLQDEGFEMISAYDGESGLKLAEEEAPDLILLDLILPRKDGFEILKTIKGKKGLSKIPVIILTNLESSQNVEQALSLGATNYLLKTDHSPSNVLDKIKQVLNVDES